MKNIRVIAVAGALTLLITGAFAAGSITTKMLAAQYMDISVVVDGSAMIPKDVNGAVVEPFLVDGTVYVPVRALGNAMGREVSWDADSNTVYVGEAEAENGTFTIRGNETNVASSGSFRAAAGQTLHLDVTSSVTGGSVDFFLFDPSGKEQRISIGGSDMTKDIALTEGTWAYNCSGKFTGGTITVVGTVK